MRQNLSEIDKTKENSKKISEIEKAILLAIENGKFYIDIKIDGKLNDCWHSVYTVFVHRGYKVSRWEDQQLNQSMVEIDWSSNAFKLAFA
jgi:hypothetical protein